MNCFDMLGGNSCLWILILLLVLGCCNQGAEGIFSGCSLPILIALVYCLCKNGTIGGIGNSHGYGCGCGCN